MIWLDGNLYFIGAIFDNWVQYNLWHWTVDVIPLWTIQFMNHLSKLSTEATLRFTAEGKFNSKRESVAPERPFYPMDYVYVSDVDNTPEWNRKLLQFLAQPDTKFLRRNQVKREDKDTAETEEYMGLRGVYDHKKNLRLRENRRLMCTKRMVYPSRRYQFFNSFTEAQMFRKKVYDGVGIGKQFYNKALTKPPPTVLFKTSGRNVINFNGTVFSVLPPSL